MLSKPMSPYAAASYDNIEIKQSDIIPPQHINLKVKVLKANEELKQHKFKYLV